MKISMKLAWTVIVFPAAFWGVVAFVGWQSPIATLSTMAVEDRGGAAFMAIVVYLVGLAIATAFDQNA